LKDATATVYEFERIEFLPAKRSDQQEPYLVEIRDKMNRFFDATAGKGKLKVLISCIKIRGASYGCDLDQEVYFPNEDKMLATTLVSILKFIWQLWETLTGNVSMSLI
jgi:hypothetical protein